MFMKYFQHSRGTHNQSLMNVYTRYGEVWSGANFPMYEDKNQEGCNFLVILFLKWNNYEFWSQKFAQAYSQCLELTMTAHFDYSFLLTLTLKTRTCVVALLVPTCSNLNPNLIEILIPYKLPMGPWLGIGASTIAYNQIHGRELCMVRKGHGDIDTHKVPIQGSQ